LSFASPSIFAAAIALNDSVPSSLTFTLCQGLTLVPASAQLELTVPLSAQLELTLSPA
jgi:hypothetical protein